MWQSERRLAAVYLVVPLDVPLKAWDIGGDDDDDDDFDNDVDDDDCGLWWWWYLHDLWLKILSVNLLEHVRLSRGGQTLTDHLNHDDGDDSNGDGGVDDGDDDDGDVNGHITLSRL